jgi:hypothetical protein
VFCLLACVGAMQSDPWGVAKRGYLFTYFRIRLVFFRLRA